MHPSDAHRKTRALKVRLIPATYAKLEALAARAGLPINAWIVAQIDAYRAPALKRGTVQRELTEARRLASGRTGKAP